jgi:hypothetical protein
MIKLTRYEPVIPYCQINSLIIPIPICCKKAIFRLQLNNKDYLLCGIHAKGIINFLIVCNISAMLYPSGLLSENFD